MALIHIDWGGTEEQLKKYDEAFKKTAEKTEGVKFTGRLTPWNKKYNYTMVLMMDNIAKFHEFRKNFVDRSAAKPVSHGEYEFYS